MTKIDKDKLNKVNGGLDFDPGGGHIEPPGIPSEVKCKQGFDSFSCNGCFFCTYSHDTLNPYIKTFICQKGYYDIIKYDLSKNKIID